MSSNAASSTSRTILSAEAVREAVERTGFPFELRMANRLDQEGYFVTPNYNFEDADTGQSREIDFHATGAVAISARREEFIHPIILGSCKDNQLPYVFFTRDNRLSDIWLQTHSPLIGSPSAIELPDGSSEPIDQYFGLQSLLHVGTAERLCGRFCEITQRGQGDKAPIGANTGIMESIMVPLIKAFAREVEDHKESVRRFESHHPEQTYVLLLFPVLILNGPMYEYYVGPDGHLALSECEQVVIARDYASRTLHGSYAIDAISASYLPKYLELVDRETKAIVGRIRRHRKKLLANLVERANQQVG